MQNSGFELLVEVNGKPIPEFGHKGRTYVQGRRDTRYELKFRNSRAERVLVVPTVDNLSVLDGNPYTEQSTGYVVPAYSSVTIKGWRTSYSEVHAFQFKDRSGSYSEKVGSGTANCGVIGAVVYSEKVWYRPVITIPTVWMTPPPPPIYYPVTTWELSSTGMMCCNSGGAQGLAGPQGPEGVPGQAAPVSTYCCVSNQDGHGSLMNATAAQSAPDFNLGTGFGAAMNDTVSTTLFERGIVLAQFEIFYSDREGLIKDGIQVDKRPTLATFPQAFGGFCKIPH